MATRLKQIISVVALAGGATQVFPHQLNWSGRKVIPDHAEPNDDDVNGSLEVLGATTTTITIRNNSEDPVTAFILLESWHTVERAFGAVQTVALVPQPFVPTRGGGGTGAGGIDVDEEGVPIGPGPFTELNFVGGNITATDAGGGVANITVAVTSGVDIQDEGVPIAGNPHGTLNFIGDGVTATDAGGGVTDITIPGGGGGGAFAAFFGMTGGPGNAGPDDYAATIAISAAGPSAPSAGSAINFPRVSAPAVGGIVINDPGVAQVNNTEFLLPAMGTYRVTWHISVDEPAQWSLWVGDASGQLPGGAFTLHTTGLGRPGAVGQAGLVAQLVGDVVFATPFANAVIQIRNFASPAALTVTPLPGGTQAQAVSLIIQQLA